MCESQGNFWLSNRDFEHELLRRLTCLLSLPAPALTWASHALTHQIWLGMNGATSRCISLKEPLGRADDYSQAREARAWLSGHLHIWSECEQLVKNGIFIAVFSFTAFPFQPVTGLNSEKVKLLKFSRALRDSLCSPPKMNILMLY